MDESVAIIGIGCRVPGADNIEEFWRVLKNGENHIVDIPDERWNNDYYYSETRETGKSFVKKAGLLKGHDEFDYEFFKISKGEAETIDPQQRLVLECTHMAFEDGGITRDKLDGSNTAVFVGAMNDDYKGLSNDDHDEETNYSATGMSSTYISARISHAYNLHGPCAMVDTACSSSMMAIHLGCQSIRTGESTMAVCGGANSILSPDQFIVLSKAGMLSRTGQCQTFCDTADGYARSEGCGIVILKSYKQALKDGDKIWGLIRTGTNQDGRTALSVAAPSSEQQLELLKRMYKQYNVDPTSLQYIEAHGTGTPVGDPVETTALGQFISSSRTHSSSKELVQCHDSSVDSTAIKDIRECSQGEGNNIRIGSVKTNIGHLESAAGAVSLIKVNLMMEHGLYVPSLHIKKDMSNLNKDIKLREHGLSISTDTSEWERNTNGERLACINSFGFGGSNVHAIVNQPRQDQLRRRATQDGIKVINISAQNRQSLSRMLDNLNQSLNTKQYNLEDIAYTSILKRDIYDYRLLVYGETVEEIQNQTQHELENIEHLEGTKPCHVIFVFCGVGTTWKGMCRNMMEQCTIFRSTIEDIDASLSPLTGWSISELFSTDTSYTNPLVNHISIFCCQVALFKTWEYYGVIPDAVIGQSVGEVAAAYASGSLSLEEAIGVIYNRSTALAKCTGGGMMVIDNMPIEVIEEVCKTFGDELNIAVYNSPVSCTISGSTNALEKLKHDLEALNQKYPKSYVKLIDVECAYHSSFTDKCLYEFSDKFRELVSKPFTKTQYSTVTGNVASDGDFQTVEYWVKNIRQPVKLMTAVQKSIVNDKVNVFLEIGPRPILRTHLKNIIPVKSAVSIASMNKNDTVNRFYKSVEKLYRTGVDVSLRKFAEFGNIVPEPRYVFNKTKLLHIPSKRALSLRGMQPSGNGHMFVRYIQGETVKIYLVIDQKSTPFVFEHYIFDRHLVPGSYYVEAAFEIGSLSSTMNFSEISVQVEFLKSVSPEIKDRTVLDVFESSSANSQGYREWLICNQSTYVCKISVKPRYKLTSKIHDISTIKGRCQNHLSKEESYKCLKSMHFTYGESLQLIHQAWSSTNECLAEFIIPDTILNQRKCTHIHPSVLDGLFQTFGVLNIGSAGQTFLPARIDSIVLNRPLEKYMFGYANLVRTSPNGKYFDAMLLTPNGEIIAEIKNFFLKHISTEQDTKHNLGYQLIWTESSLPLNAVAKPFELENVLIIGDRHIYDEFRVSETSDMSFIGWNDGTEINFENYRHIIVAALDTVDDKMHYDNMCVYNQCVGHFTQMKSLIEAANKHSFSGSIYVLTENVANKCSQSNNAIRVNGAELWGMVRSALLEYPYMKMHIVDIEVNQENLAILKKVIRAENVQPIECLIRQGKLFYSEIVALDVIETSDTIKSTPSNLENVKLKSVESNAIESPFFSFNEFSEVEGAGGLFCEIELESICLHDSGVYPLTADDGEDDCFDFNDNCSSGHTVICIEGIGVNRENKARVGFCWPSETCSRLSIPKSCTFDVDKVSYVPGLMSVALLLHNIAQKCTNDQRVHIVIDENTRLVQQMFSQCNCIIQTYDNNEATQDLYEANVLVLLTKLPCKLVKHLVTDNSHLECIITYKPFITRTTAVSIERNTPLVDLKILNPEDVFKSTGLEKTVPIVSKKLHLMNNELESNKGDNIRNTKPKRGHILHLPYKSLSTKNGGTQNVSIPLHVPENNLFRKNCCYVVVGGLSGLGWELLVYMAELGAGFIATIHRRCPSPEQKKKIRNIEEKLKCKIIPCNADVTNLDELNDTFKKLHKRLGNGVDVMGVLHGGGVLDDCVLEDMTTESIEKVLSPKVLGTLNLHQATKHMNLDFFIMHSSIVSITGNHGQCNYAAGNSFMDAFAMYRRSQELCGQSINWSALSVGMAMKSQQALKLERKGFTFLSIEEIRRCFLFAIKSGYTQVSFGKFDWGKLKDDLLTKRNIRKYSSLTGVYSTENVGKSRLRSLDMTSFFQISIEHRSMIVRELIYSAVKDVFVCSNIELSDNLVFGSLGIDSMASMHFINYIRQATNVELPMSILYADSTTIGSLCDMLLEKLEERRNNSNSSDEKDSMHAKQLSEYLQGVVPFTQVSLLNDFIENRFTKNIMRQVDIEVIGDKIQSLDDWKEIFNHLLKIEPDLRRIFVLDKKPFQSYLIKDATISIEEVSFDCIGHSDVSDDRDSICMDITKDIPISIKIAISGERTRLRFFIHGLLGDLPAVTMIFHQFANIATAYATNRALPEPRPCEVSPVDAFREAFIPRANTLQKFWSSIQWKDVKPFTLGKSLTNVLDEKYWAEISVSVPKAIAETVIDSKHISIYNFITSAYMALLHKETHSEFIPLVTYVDMRGHVHDLHKSIISCSNGMPILGDFRKLGKVEEFLETSSELLSGMTQQSAYPYELILKEIQSEELRTEIGRHRIIMEDFTSINQVMTFENSIVNYKMFFKRHVYETSLHVIYDKRTYDIKLEFGYNSSVVDGDVAQKILRNLVTVIDDFIQTPEASMSDILDKVDNKSTNDCLPISYKHLPMST